MSCGSVCEHTAAVHIANGVDAWHGGLHVVVHLNASAAHLNAQSFNALRNHRFAAHSHQHSLTFDSQFFAFSLVGDGVAVFAFGD